MGNIEVGVLLAPDPLPPTIHAGIGCADCHPVQNDNPGVILCHRKNSIDRGQKITIPIMVVGCRVLFTSKT